MSCSNDGLAIKGTFLSDMRSIFTTKL